MILQRVNLETIQQRVNLDDDSTESESDDDSTESESGDDDTSRKSSTTEDVWDDMILDSLQYRKLCHKSVGICERLSKC